MKNLYMSLGIRNVLRNKKRSLITASVIGIGIASLSIGDGFIVGFMDYMVKNATSDYMGQARIHGVEYDKNFESKYYIDNYQIILDEVLKDSRVAAVVPRTMFAGMVSSASNNVNITGVGIDPSLEVSFSKIKQRIKSGDFLNNNDNGSILIGSRLAKRLAVEVGNKVVLTTTNAKNSDLVQELFRVKGIFEFSSKGMDEQFAFINLKKSQDMLGIGDAIHEIAINYKDISGVDYKNYSYTSVANRKDLHFQSWKEFMPSLSATVEMSSQSLGYIAILFGFLIALAVANTVNMSLYERIYEFGVMRAVGTRKSAVIKMVLFESFGLGLLGLGVGVILMATLGSYLVYYGVDYSGLSYATVTIRDPIYIKFTFMGSVILPLITVIFVVFVSYFPIRKIMKITPSQALRERS